MDIKIGKSARECAACETPFVHDAPVTSIVQRVEGEWRRTDFCTTCATDDRVRDAFSIWNGTYFDPAALAGDTDETHSPLRTVFYDAVAKESRPDLALAYLAAQLLRRQKVFRWIKESRDPDTDESVILFSDRIGNTLIEVHDPNLSTAELERGRVALMEHLQQLEPDTESETEDDEEASPENGQDESEFAEA